LWPVMDDTRPAEYAPAYPNALPNGTVIAGYRIERVLGAGGFGITYKAFNPVTRHTVAIKEFFPVAIAASRGEGGRLLYSTSDAKLVSWALDRFERTTTELCRLRHEHIVRVLNYIRERDTGYMIMDYVDGMTLEAWLRARPSPPTADDLRPLLDPVLD